MNKPFRQFVAENIEADDPVYNYRFRTLGTDGKWSQPHSKNVKELANMNSKLPADLFGEIKTLDDYIAYLLNETFVVAVEWKPFSRLSGKVIPDSKATVIVTGPENDERLMKAVLKSHQAGLKKLLNKVREENK